MIRAFLTIFAAGLLCANAATINTTLTVTNAAGSLTGTGVTATGPATLSGIGSGTFNGTLSLTPGTGGNLTAPFTITLTNGDTIRGTLLIPPSALTGSSANGS